MNIRQIFLLSCSFLLLSCQTTPDERHFASGDAVSLNRSLNVPALFSHVILQYGEVIDEVDLYAYDTSCIVDSKNLGPGNIQPQSYEVSKVTYNEEMFSDGGAIIRYFTEIYLDSDEPDKNLILTCQKLDDTMMHHSFPVDEIKQASGRYFSF